jgi:hypothetical protein
VPTRRADNDAERFARIEALMEEYRVKHEDLEAFLRATRTAARQNRTMARQNIETARALRANRRNRR